MRNRSTVGFAIALAVVLAAAIYFANLAMWRGVRIDGLNRRIQMERELHEQDWQAQQQALAAERGRVSALETQIDRLRKE